MERKLEIKCLNKCHPKAERVIRYSLIRLNNDLSKLGAEVIRENSTGHRSFVAFCEQWYAFYTIPLSLVNKVITIVLDFQD